MSTKLDINTLIKNSETIKTNNINIRDVTNVINNLPDANLDSNIKLFSSVEQMNNYENKKENEIAVVYTQDLVNMDINTVTQFITFPEQVVLTESIVSNPTNRPYITLTSTDSSILCDISAQLDNTQFIFSGYTETNQIYVKYISEDGLTYTRTEFYSDNEDLINPINLNTTVGIYDTYYWNDSIGYFMLVPKDNLQGVYKGISTHTHYIGR